jgi:glycerol-3-phosphate dehydrogenase
MAERLAVECALAARNLGADVANYAEVLKVERLADRHNLSVRDSLNGDELDVLADVVINATGPWVDGFLHRTGLEVPPLIGGTRGSHIVIPRERLEVNHAIYAPARSDGRPFFVLPWLGMFLVGTTDVRHSGDPDEATATVEEADYLLSEINSLLGSDIGEDDVVYSYSGVRPLPYDPKQTEGAITRRHFLVDHASDGMPGLYSLVGGKLTTYRSVGQRSVDMVKRRLGERWPVAPEAPTGQADVPEAIQLHWGPRAGEVYSKYRGRPELLEPICEHSPEPKAAIIEAVRGELATGLADVFLRRTSIGWRRCGGEHVADDAVSLIGDALGWKTSRCDEEAERYRREADRVRPTKRPQPAGDPAP